MKKPSNGYGVILVIALVIIALGIIIAGGTYVSRHQQNAKDDKYFAALVPKANSYYEAQAKGLGLNTNGVGVDRFCVHQDEGWMANVRLICYAQTQKKITIVPDADEIDQLLTKFEAELKNEGFTVYGKIFDKSEVLERGFSISASSSDCKVSLQNSPATAHPDSKTTVDYDLSCGRDSSHVPPGYPLLDY